MSRPGVLLAGVLALAAAAGLAAQDAAPGVTYEQLTEAIGRLGAFEYADRVKAARTVRRAPGTMALPALVQAVHEHADGYVRYRALVILAGYDDPRVPDVMQQVVTDPNDRLREVAYRYFARHPEQARTQDLLAAFEKEMAEFVRPALMRALAARAEKDPSVRPALLRDVTRGQDFFRSAVIEALGDHKAAWAREAVSGVAALDGPLQDDAVLALGKMGDKAAMTVLAGLQRTAPRENQPVIAAAICLVGVNCSTHRGFLVRTLAFAEDTIGFQELVRGAATGLAAIAATGDADAANALFDRGVPAVEPVRPPLALAVATFAMKNPALLLDVLGKRSDRQGSIELLRDGFDMLDEDFDEEMFFVTVRRAHWAAPEGSPVRALVQSLVQELDF